MAKRADIGSKRLIGLTPTTWTRWLTGDESLQGAELLSGEFQWVSRANDALLRVQSVRYGEYLVANEIQLRPDRHMARRIRAYAALAEEHYRLNVYPVVVNILPGAAGTELPAAYHNEFMDLVAHQDFRTINLWEVDASVVFEQGLDSLLPFVPVLRGGGEVAVVTQAVARLRSIETLAELEPLLAFFASFVMETELVRTIMRWDMTVLRESPWYAEILQEGVEQGIEQGIKQGIERGIGQGEALMLVHVLRHRFGTLPPAIEERLHALSTDQLQRLAVIAVDAASLQEVVASLDSLAAETDVGNG